MKDDSQYDKPPPLRWTGVRRALLVGAIIGVAAATALELYPPPPQPPPPPILTPPTQARPKTFRHSRHGGFVSTSIESGASPWFFLPALGAGLGAVQRLVRNNWRW